MFEQPPLDDLARWPVIPEDNAPEDPPGFTWVWYACSGVVLRCDHCGDVDHTGDGGGPEVHAWSCMGRDRRTPHPHRPTQKPTAWWEEDGHE